MKTSGKFSLHKVEINAKIGEPFKLIPFGDVHRESDMHAHDHWQDFLAYAKKQKNAVFIGMGDYSDGNSTSERIVLNGPEIHDTTRRTLDGVYKGVTKTLANELAFMRSKCIGLLGGNHFYDFGDGNTTDHLLAASLNTKYLGVCTLTRIDIKIAGFSGCWTMDICAHHGKGGGRNQFKSIEDLQRIANADIYLMGHTHGKGCVPDGVRLEFASNSRGHYTRERIPWLGRTGSFLKCYEDGRVSYNVDACRPPNALGWIEFEITPMRARTGGENRIYLNIRGTA